MCHVVPGSWSGVSGCVCEHSLAQLVCQHNVSEKFTGVSVIPHSQVHSLVM